MSTDPNKIIYSMIRVNKNYNNKPVIKDISLSYFYGAKIGVLGLNGSGKSSLLRIMAGVDDDFNGEAHLSPGYTVGYLEQEPLLDDDKTVRQVVEEGVQETVDLVNEFNEINAKFAEPMDDDAMTKLIERQGVVQEKLDHLGAWDLDSKLEMAMDALRCPPGDAKVNVLSGGERRRVALCRLLLQKPDILLLDEPTNHLDAETVAWLEHHLADYAGTVIAVTHDRYFLDNVAGWILELDRGQGIPWKGNYSSWLSQKKDRLQKEEKEEGKRQKTLERELEWINMSPKGRQTKAKARIKSYENLLDAAHTAKLRELEIYIPPGPRLGDVVIQAEGVSKAYDDRLLVENLTFALPPGGIVGVIGPNGAGKTTLFRMITGEETPDNGTIRVGETVELAYVEQSRASLDPTQTIWQAISGGEELIQLGDREINSRAYVSRFNFGGSQQQKKLNELSGGERNRVHLARMLKSGANVILLDEPTNDLDVNTMRALEEALEAFGGCAVVISHDRWFLDRLATHILAFEGDSQAVWHEGNWSDYEADRKRRLGAEAEVPHRIKYRHLTRGSMTLRNGVLAVLAFLVITSGSVGMPALAAEITLERIMSHPDWIGTKPEAAYWSDDGTTVYYDRRILGSELKQRYALDLATGDLREVAPAMMSSIDHAGGDWSADWDRKVYAFAGDLFLKTVSSGEIRQLTRTSDRESAPRFLSGDRSIVYQRDSDLYVVDLENGLVRQVAEIQFTRSPDEKDAEKKETFYTEQQERLFAYLRQTNADKEERQEHRDAQRQDPALLGEPWYLGEKHKAAQSSLSPDGSRLVLVLAPAKTQEGRKAKMPAWITDSGFVEPRDVRTVVGDGEVAAHSVVVLDLERHTQHAVDLSGLPGITDDPLKELREAQDEKKESRKEKTDDAEPKPRDVRITQLAWSDEGVLAMQVFSNDHKDRWIVTVRDSVAHTVHHEQDPAWINWRGNIMGWMPGTETLYFTSEASGYRHLYAAKGGKKAKALTSGDYVVSAPQPSRDGRTITFLANRDHPGVYEMYRVAVDGGQIQALTRMGGRNTGHVSPDGTRLLITHSTATHPDELYLVHVDGEAEPKRLTDTVSEEFLSMDWTEPRYLAVPSTHHDRPIHSRLYLPKTPLADGETRPAVMFVHGAGYLQNAHQGWSSYFREFMFHSLLVEQGFVVLDMDYRASAGYGRDWRTAIYRQMGTPELEDLQDGVTWLAENAGVDPERVGVYGGSYGGFLTCMALFKEPDLFACGAALRLVSDWAHYNHWYTSRILNTPELDPEAYNRSSPIEFAEGLSKPLLMCAPMMDNNVFFLDTVRLVQRLIELEKQDFETAIYPVEPHTFVQPSSWLDEYRRIWKLFDTHLR